jgi:23S rRNA pseudouridine1911/1915/1917 synthase
MRPWRPIAFVPGFRVVAEALDWIVVDKPAPLQVHPAKPDSPPTLLDGLEQLLAYEMANGARLSILNRLDRETSGLVMVAKNRGTARVLGKAIMRREVEKSYLALVHEWPAEDDFVVDAALRRRSEIDPTTPVGLMQAVHPGGASSCTEVSVRARWERKDAGGAVHRLALVEARPLTGRMHQIRLHLSHVGHPVVGDKLYGPGGPGVYLRFLETGWTDELREVVWLPRHALHSCRLAVEAETLGRLAFESPLPEDLAAWVAAG